MGRRGRGTGRQRMNRPGPRRSPGARKDTALGPQAQQRLQQAHAQLTSGEPAAAAATFARMAEVAQGKGRHGMATHLALHGVRALVHAGDRDAALSLAQKAVQYGAPAQNQRKIAQRFAQTVKTLQDAGHPEAAEAVAEAARTKMQIQKLPEVPVAQPVNRAVRRSLPKHCGACGGPVSSADVAFDENGTADCHYCGVVLVG